MVVFPDKIPAIAGLKIGFAGKVIQQMVFAPKKRLLLVFGVCHLLSI